MIDGNFSVVISSRMSELRELAELVERFGEEHQLPVRKNFIINLALDELVTNTLMHGDFEGDEEPRIAIDLSTHNNRIVVVITSNGGKFDPTEDTEPDTTSELADRPIGGLGLHLVKTQADGFHYEFVDGLNKLTLEYNVD